MPNSLEFFVKISRDDICNMSLDGIYNDNFKLLKVLTVCWSIRSYSWLQFLFHFMARGINMKRTQ